MNSSTLVILVLIAAALRFFLGWVFPFVDTGTLWLGCIGVIFVLYALYKL